MTVAHFEKKQRSATPAGGVTVQACLPFYLFHPERLGDGFVDHRRVEQGLLGRERSVHDDLLLGRNVQRHVRLQSSEQERS